VTGRRDGHLEIKWHPSQPVQRVADGTPEPIGSDIPILRGVFLFPKFASGTLVKSRENKGNDMSETSEDDVRERFFRLVMTITKSNQAMVWGQNRVLYLEQEMEEMLDTIKRLNADVQRLTEITSRNSTTLVGKSAEGRHQRHRRERMLDEVTLICIRDEIGVYNGNLKRFGERSRNAAADICIGINEHDANH
jgi:hypothetical protein